MLPIALIERVEPAIAGIAYTQPPPANATDQQALQQTKALSGRSGEYFAVRSVGRQAVAVGEELIPGDIPCGFRRMRTVIPIDRGQRFGDRGQRLPSTASRAHSAVSVSSSSR